MGAKHSKGPTRADVHAILPSSWSELEVFYGRFQQEAFRRRTTDPQSQFFLSFPDFRRVMLGGREADAWDTKERLLRVFAVLDRNHRKRIAAIDFFAGLALVTEGKKATKFEFLFSLLDNGGLKTLNTCEVVMVLTAAARGLEMFKTIPPVQEDLLVPLARRLLGEQSEVPRSTLVEKALTDPEIVFFMNDLDNEVATTSDALLVQQGKLMKTIAANELQFGCAEVMASSPQNGIRQPKHAHLASSVPAARVLTAEAMLRRLQAILQPPVPPQQKPSADQDGDQISNSTTAAVKRIDARSLCRLINTISDGLLELKLFEANRIVSTLNADEIGFVKHSDLLRATKSWLMQSSLSSPPIWKAVGHFVSERMREMQTAWMRWISPSMAKATYTINQGSSFHHLPKFGSEISYSFKANINTGSTRATSANAVRDKEDASPKCENAALRARLNLHNYSDTSESSSPRDVGQLELSQRFVVALSLRLRTDVTDEEAINVASAVEQFFSDNTIRSHVDFAVERCEATVVESQVGECSSRGVAAASCLLLRFVLNADIYNAMKMTTGCCLQRLVRSFFVSLDFDTSLEDIIREAEAVVSMHPNLVKLVERERVSALIFKRFDKDNDGLWNLQEFNTFQQAMEDYALDDTAFVQCFGARREIGAADFADCFRHCSTETFRILIETLGYGSVFSQLRGVCAASITLDESQLLRLESSLSSLRWGHGVLKRLTFVLRTFTDLSCDFHCQSIGDLLVVLGVKQEWWLPLERASSLVEWFNTMTAFLTSRHNEHDRDFTCRSLFCSLDEELSKSPQQLDLEDQQGNLPQGSSKQQADLLRKVRNLATTVFACVDGIQSIALESSETRLVCEIDNFNLVHVLRKAVNDVKQPTGP